MFQTTWYNKQLKTKKTNTSGLCLKHHKTKSHLTDSRQLRISIS